MAEKFIATAHKTAIQFYTPDKASQICELHAAGVPLCKIVALPEMPAYGTLWRWQKDHPEFKADLEEARRIKAQWHEEQAMELALGEDKDEVPSTRLQFDAHKWAAEINDPGRYGKKTTLQGDGNAPVTFIISTGFPELQEHQKQPLIGVDGLIIKKMVDVAESEESVGDAAPTPE